jgi:hypothetical protein
VDAGKSQNCDAAVAWPRIAQQIHLPPKRADARRSYLDDPMLGHGRSY